MWWNEGHWGPMYGWWFMPLFGLFCMLIFIYFISQIIKRNGGCCGPPSHNHPPVQTQERDELLDEIRALRHEVDELRKNTKKNQR